ncbi:putative RTA1 domain protein [Pyrenochaeta sp. MPI-SDFR-AT-0127]|nr:putative RTA1 domain protein [Pyrenochaeta sp. MPI-SDFR-AT-0127]
MAQPTDPDDFVYYHYRPSIAAAIIFTILFFLTTGLHIYQCARKRAWFLTPFIIGGIFQFLGYIGRILSHNDQWALGPYIMQTLLLLLAPALYAASIYMILGRIILLTNGEQYALIRRKWLTKLFVTGDVLSFLIQGGGGGVMSGGNESNMNTGETMVIVGLWVQIAVFGLFVVVALLFQRKGRVHLQSLAEAVPWRKYMYSLYGMSVLILVRSAFRVIEYIQGNDGYLLRHEVFLYIFDAVLMFAVMVVMNVVHPGDIAIMLKEKEHGKTSHELRDSGLSTENMV